MYKTTMALALLVIAASAQSAELAQSVELMQVMSAHEITAGTLKRGMRQQKAAGSLTAKQLECVEAIPASDFRSSVASAIRGAAQRRGPTEHRGIQGHVRR